MDAYPSTARILMMARSQAKAAAEKLGNFDFIRAKNWAFLGTYAGGTVEDSDPPAALSPADSPSLRYSQGFTWDSKRERFVVACISAGQPSTYQELKALDQSDFSTALAKGHTDLEHANSLTYVPDTDEILCMTTLVENSKRLIRVIDAGTLATKSTIELPTTAGTLGQYEFHLAYDRALRLFVMSRQLPLDGGTPHTGERFWVCGPVFDNANNPATVTGFHVRYSFDVLYNGADINLNNGLGAHNGIAIAGGSHCFVVDYIAGQLVNAVFCGSHEIEDFCFASDAWHVSVNLSMAVFRLNSKMETGGRTLQPTIIHSSRVASPTIKGISSRAVLRFYGGTDATTGSALILAGQDFGSDFAGGFKLRCRTSIEPEEEESEHEDSAVGTLTGFPVWPLYNYPLLKWSGSFRAKEIVSVSASDIPTIRNKYNDNAIRIWGGATGDAGASMALCGRSFASNEGIFTITAKAADTVDGEGNPLTYKTAVLRGTPGGALSWSGYLSGMKASSSASVASLASNSDSGVLRLAGGTTTDSGATLYLGSKGWSQNPGYFLLTAKKEEGGSTVSTALRGYPSGALSWGGDPLQTASDERLKTPLAAIPDEVLDAWGEVNWGQFRYLAAVSEKGEAARLHTGLIAQRIKTVFETRGLDACRYGLLCYDAWDDQYEDVEIVDQEEVLDGDGEIISPKISHTEQRKIQDAGDRWSVRYAEALAMEAAYQRRRADRIEARLETIETRISAIENA